MALVTAAAAVYHDPSVGSRMSSAELGRRTKTEFVQYKSRPVDACSLNRSGCSLDNRRWNGRSAEGCRKYYERVRSEGVPTDRSKGLP